MLFLKNNWLLFLTIILFEFNVIGDMILYVFYDYLKPPIYEENDDDYN